MCFFRFSFAVAAADVRILRLSECLLTVSKMPTNAELAKRVEELEEKLKTETGGFGVRKNFNKAA